SFKYTENSPQELRQKSSRVVYSGCQYVCAGLGGSKSTGEGFGDSDHGMYPCRQNGRLPRRTTSQDSQGCHSGITLIQDESPYVRKTAVICVAKLFDINQSMCLENGFLELLQDMVNDANPM